MDILAEVDISAEQGTSTMVMTSTSLIRQEEPMPADNPEHVRPHDLSRCKLILIADTISYWRSLLLGWR